MFNVDRKSQASDIVLRVLETLDITPTQHEEAVKRYEAVGAWLCAEGSPLACYQPEVAPQGSFKIGTVIKPWTNADLFDIDLTIKFATSEFFHTQRELKVMLGARLIAHDTYKRMLDAEHRRCWRLIYAENTRFHMDLVPAIPDNQFRLVGKGVPVQFCTDPLAITDNLHLEYDDLHANWPKSNMVGFSAWFIERMSYRLGLEKKAYALREGMGVEQVKFYQVKTPLQRVVQLLKRHRDMMFEGDEDAPISVIITTLAARAYDQYQNDDLYSTILGVTNRLREKVEQRIVDGKTVYWISNPVNPDENFADKWEHCDRKRQLFFAWIERVEHDFKDVLARPGIHRFTESLKGILGGEVVSQAVNAQAQATRSARETGTLLVTPTTGVLNQVSGRKVPDHQNYGSK